MVQTDDGLAPSIPDGTRILAVGLSPAARERLSVALGCDVVVDPSEETTHCVVSSRVVSGSQVRDLAGRGPVLVLAAPGGGDEAVTLLRDGATAIVPEGAEHAVRAFVAGGGGEPILVEALRRYAGPLDGRPSRPGGPDSSGLPGADRLEAQLAELAADPTAVTHLLSLHVAALADDAATAPGVVTLVRRRIATRWRSVLTPHGAELYATDDPTRFAVAWPSADPAVLPAVADELAAAVAPYAPGGRGLALGVGHVGPADAEGPATALELAGRAAAHALATGRVLVPVEQMLADGAPDVGLDVLLRATAVAEADLSVPRGHGTRCAELVVAVGRRLGLPGEELELLRLAARLHELGGATDVGEGRAATTASLLQPLAGDLVAAIVRNHGIAVAADLDPGVAIGAQLLGAAHRWDLETAGIHADGTEELLEALGTEGLRADVVSALGVQVGLRVATRAGDVETADGPSQDGDDAGGGDGEGLARTA